MRNILLGLFAVAFCGVNAQTEITTAEQFKNLDLNGNYKLMADIDLTTGSIVPIGGRYSYTCFNGTFDGNGHTIRISNISDDYQYRGLFSFVGTEGVIKNLKVTGQMDNSVSVASLVGGIAGWNDGTIINCFSSVSVNCSGVLNNQPRSQTGGGIAGVNTGTISFCVAAGSIMGATYSGGIGGIVGVNYSNNSGKIENCIYGGDEIYNPNNSSNSYYGMICGDVHDDSWANNVSNCFYKANDALTGLGSPGRKVADGSRCTPLSQDEFRALLSEGGIYASTEYDVFRNSILMAVAPYSYLNLDTKEMAGFATFYNGDCDYKANDNVAIYTGIVKGSNLYLLEMNGHIIPKGVPVILRSEKRYFSLYKSYTECTFNGRNDLKGTDNDLLCSAYSNFILGINSESSVFVLNDGTKVSANTAYLPCQEEIEDYDFLSIKIIELSPVISFVDDNVKAICVANWDINGDGDLNEGEAAAVTDIGIVFKGNTNITSFDEFKYFTGLNTIGDYSFNGCSNLNKITIPNNVSSIGKGSFGGTGFTNIDIPEGVQSIGKEAFARCNNLVKVKLPSTMSTIHNYAFAWSDNSLSVIFLSSNPPSLGIGSFYSTYTKSIAYVPIGSKTKYEEAYGVKDYFKGIIEINPDLLPLLPQALKVSIPSTVAYGNAPYTLPTATEEGLPLSWSVSDTYIASIINNVLTIKNAGTIVLTASNEGNELYLPYNQELTITICKAPLKIIADNQTKSVGDANPELTISYDGFMYDDDVSVLNTKPSITTTATIDSPVGTYPIFVSGAASNNYDFTYVNGTLTVTSPPIFFTDANVKAICVANWDTDGNGELSEDEAAAVTDIDKVFNGNHSIISFDELKYFTELNAIGNNAFEYCRNLTSITIPNSVTNIGNSAFWDCNLESIVVPNSVTKIDDWAFMGCSNMKSLIIGNSLTNISPWAFVECSGLAAIEVNTGNPQYDSRDNCNAIIKTSSNALIVGCDNTNIPNSVTSIGTAAFRGRNSLTSMTIPNNVISIDQEAFFECSGLKSITIPNSVTSIGRWAFYGCGSLTSVTVSWNTPITITEDEFSNRANATLFVPKGCKAAYQAADYWKEFKEIVEIPSPYNNRLTVIGSTICKGGKINLPVFMNNEEEITAFQFDVELPQGISVTDVQLGERKSDSHTVDFSKQADGSYRVIAVSLQKALFSGNEGELVSLMLSADKDIEGGDYSVGIKNIVLTTPPKEKLYPADVNSVLTVLNIEQGDADGDGFVDVADVVTMIDYILDSSTSDIVFLAADMNADGEIDIFDVMIAINIVLKRDNPSGSRTRASGNMEEQAVVTATADGIMLGVNDAGRFTAFQFDIEVADGMELTAARLNDNSGNHELYSMNIGQNTYRVIGVSMDNSTLTASGNDLIELSFSKGGHVQISNIVFVTPQKSKVYFACGNSEVTGIGRIGYKQAEEIYDLSGRKVNTDRSRLPKGLYIINNKKVVIK